MNQTSPHSYYQRTAVETASPARRVIMLLDGGIRFLSLALPAMRERNYELQSTLIGRAQDIVAHLQTSMDRTVAGPLAPALDAVYVPLYDMLTDANVHDKQERVERAIEIFRELREAWVEVDRQCQAEKSAGREVRALIAA